MMDRVRAPSDSPRALSALKSLGHLTVPSSLPVSPSLQKAIDTIPELQTVLMKQMGSRKKKPVARVSKKSKK